MSQGSRPPDPTGSAGCVVYICESGTAGGHRASGSIASFWQHTMEASPILISAENHDRQLAWTSHLPQAVAYALARSLADHGLAGVSYGSGARDTTRLAASNPDMWVDILLYNQPAVSEALARTEAHLAELRRLLATGDAAGLRVLPRCSAGLPQGNRAMKVGGSVRVPGDKSITHRVLLLAALTRGTSHIGGALTSLDARSTARVLRQLGAELSPLRPGVPVTVRGKGKFRRPDGPLFCGNSGTTTRLLLGLLSAHRFSATLTGRSFAAPPADAPGHGSAGVHGSPLHRTER